MSERRSRVLPVRSEPPDSIFFNTPSVERTGHGDDIICEECGERYFYASEEWVRDGCEDIIIRYANGECVNLNDLYTKWNIEPSQYGYRNGWPTNPDYAVDLSFVFTWCGPGTRLFDKFGQKVLLVEPKYDAFPMEDYLELS